MMFTAISLGLRGNKWGQPLVGTAKGALTGEGMGHKATNTTYSGENLDHGVTCHSDIASPGARASSYASAPSYLVPCPSLLTNHEVGPVAQLKLISAPLQVGLLLA